jgi:hypothetical protein
VHPRWNTKISIAVFIAITISTTLFLLVENDSFRKRHIASINTTISRSVVSINITIPFMAINSHDDSSYSKNQPTLVYTCLGQEAFTKHQPYIWESLRQARLITGFSLSIVVIMSRHSQTSNIQSGMNQLNVTTIIYEDLLLMNNASFALVSDFRQAFFIQGGMTPNGNVDFNQLTTERLFALYAYMTVNRKSNVFHIENDNMLYYDLTDLMHRMHACCVYLGLTRASLTQVVFSFLYVRSASILEHFLRFTIEVFRLGRTKAMDYLKTEWINDMTITSQYLDLFAATPEMSKLNGISQLPITFNSTNCCLCTSNNNAETIIFDARTLGQYFGGDYWHPNVSFWWRNDFIDPRGKLLVWTKTQKGLLIPFIKDKRIVNLHVHSKQLERFSSRNDNQPTGKGYNFTIIAKH